MRESERPKMKLLFRSSRGLAGMTQKLDFTTWRSPSGRRDSAP
jgi:hypothetical protein